MAHLMPKEMANEYNFDQENELPQEIMSNRLSFDGKYPQSQAYSSNSIAVYAKNIQKAAELEPEFEEEEESMSDVDETMNRYRNRYSKKNASGSLKDLKVKRVTIEEEEEAPEKSFDSYLNKKDQNIKISNLLKKNNEKMKQRETEEKEKVYYDPNEDTLTLNQSKIERDLQSNERFIRDNLPSSKYVKNFEYNSNSGTKPQNEYNDNSLVKQQSNKTHNTIENQESATKLESSPELQVRYHEPQSNYMKYLLKKQETQKDSAPRSQKDRNESPQPPDMTKKSWEHPKFKNLQQKYNDEKAEMYELERMDFKKKSLLVRRSLESLQQDNEYLNVQTKPRESKVESYIESSVENTFRQKNDTSKKTNRYEDTEDRKDQFLDSIGSLSKQDIEGSSKYKVRKEFSSGNKNSTIKEASASNMEETIGAAEYQDRLMGRGSIHIEPYKRPQSTQLSNKKKQMVNQNDHIRYTEQKKKDTKVIINGLTTMESIEPFKLHGSLERDNLTMGNVNRGSVPTTGQCSQAQLQGLNANSSKKQIGQNVNVFYPQKQSSEEAPYVKSFHTKQFSKSADKKVQQREQDPLLKFEVPDDNLMAVCIIKAARQDYKSINERQKSNEKRLGGSRQSSARSPSVPNMDGKRRSRSFINQDKSLASGRSYGSKRSVSGIHRKLQGFGNTTSSNLDLSLDLDLLPSKNENSIQFFTTHCQSSHIVLKQQFEEKISEKMIKSLLRYDVDCNKFLNGLYEEEGNLRMYQFDKVISESQHSRALNVESWQYLRAWLVHSKIVNEQKEQPLKFCFLFGSLKTQKSEMLNLMNTNSLLQEFLKELRDPIQYLKITMFFQDQEFVLNSRQFNNNNQSKREIGMEIREALRDRTRLVQKLTQQQPNLAIYIQKCSHFRIQINNYVFVDMADLRGLKFHEDVEVVQTLTNDFGSMTNEILRQSQFYENHDFQLNQDQEASAFNGFLLDSITPSSKILLLTFISNDPDDEISSSIALDFSHKIRQYYQGNSDECIIPQIIKEDQYDRENLQNNYQKLQVIFEKLAKMKKRVNRELLKAEKQFSLNVSFQNIQQKIQSHNKFQQLFLHFRDFVQKAIHEEFAQIFDNLHMAFIESQIGSELDSIQIVIQQLEKLIEHKNPGLIEATNKLIVEPFPERRKSRGRSKPSGSLQRVESLGGRAKSSSNVRTTSGNFVSSFGGPNVHSSQQFKSSSNINVQPMHKSSSGKLKTVKQNPYRSQVKTINSILDKKTMNQLTHLSNKIMKKKMSSYEQARASSRLSQGNRNKSIGIESNRSNSVNKPWRRNKVPPMSKNFDQNRVNSPNEDIPVETLREKLSHDIEQTLSSLKKKRSTINLDTNINQVMEYKSNLLSDCTGLESQILNQSVQSEVHSKTMEIQNFKNIYKMQDKSNTRESNTSRGQPQRERTKSNKDKNKKKKSKSKQKQEKSEYRDISPQFDMPEKQPNPFKDSIIKTEGSPNLMQESTPNRNQIHEVKSLKFEVQRLKQQLLFQSEEHKTSIAMMDIELQNKEAQILGHQQNYTDAERKINKLSKNSTKKDDQDKIVELQMRFEEMKTLKEKSDELNKQILKQVGLMKETIKDSQQRERLNIQLLEKNKDKNEKITILKENEKMLHDQIRNKDQNINKLKDKVSKLEEITEKSIEIAEENQDLKKQNQKLKNKVSEQEKDGYSVDDLIEKNEVLERARDKFRNQTLDQKQEIKKLKSQLESYNLKASFQESVKSVKSIKSINEERPLRKITPNQDDRRLPVNIQHKISRDDSDDTASDEVNQPRNRKNEVIKDIKSLIKQLK